MPYKKVNQKQSFPKLEEEILKFWDKNKIFEKSISSRKDAEEFNFYDGPPFATWTPHYWHILAGTIKDVIPRYQTMLWKKVERVFGWDCHWLPIENIVEKKLKISWKEDIENKIWVYDFNESCKANVFWFVDEWKQIVKRTGRWVDMENDYKTMDADFMESVWWVFKSIYDKWLIYEWNKIVPYCPRCSTPLSNFEVNQWYKDKQDKTITVKFKVIWNENKYILAWTTTPWTLYANLWLAVWENIIYAEIFDKKSSETYILAEDRLTNYYKNEDDYSIIKKYPWSCLKWLNYQALFDDFKIQIEDMWKDLWTKVELWKNSYKVALGHHVTTESWTWVVHIAPAYWEDDNIIWQENDLWFVTHIDDTGKTYNLLEKNSKYVFDFNKDVIQELKQNKKAIHIWTINHSYPHCWRCDTPLIYRAISAWYVAVEKIKDRMVANNLKTHWSPETIKTGRFGKWLEWARDWNISRNRYWWSAIPVWQSEDKKTEICIGSVDKLYELNKNFWQIKEKDWKYYYTNSWEKVDLHKHFVDEIFVQNKNNFQAKNILWIHGFKRTNKVIDFLEKTSKNLKIEGINMDSPVFEEWENILYKNWEQILDKLNMSSYDTIITHSMWWRVAMEYIIEKKLKLNRLILVSSTKTWSWTKEVTNFYSVMKHNLKNINKYVKEIVLITSKDDTITRVEWARKLAKEINATLIEVNWFGHFNVIENKIIEWIIKYWTPLKRIPEVLDCWFESGAMPYASKHYPFAFENKKGFKFPADFIAEWLDQTRWWFYTLIILSTALFDSPATMNTIVNGIVLAEDWKKMSKSLNNYPDPKHILNDYGADAMRFYLMNSPVVEAQDFRFTESWVEEVVKKVILPLWNTYSFFTTYANIDNFKPNKWNLYFIRHGESERNTVPGLMNPWDIDSPLTKKGIQQAIKAWKQAKIDGIKFDIIISSPLSRAYDTAKLVAKEIWYTSKIIKDDRLLEQLAWKLKDYTHEQITKEFKTTSIVENRNIFRDIKYNGIEDTKDFEKRTNDFIKEITKKYKWKNILIVAHSGVSRPFNKYFFNLSTNEAFFERDSVPNATILKLPNIPLNNPLDKWIISELYKLISEVKKWFDQYKLNKASAPIVKFMDLLTNWYIRRSRKRFWKSENDTDKLEAYHTLHYILVNISKIISPFMPFVSEEIYKNLTWNESVHLSIYPANIEAFIDEELNKDMDKTKKIINLWLAWRVNHKIRVRQPLSNITIAEELNSYYEEIIKEELNVKTVLYTDWNNLAKQVCKPNWRLIWPKFWKDVKIIMKEAKSWNFKQLENWDVKVWEFVLEKWEFELVFESSDSKYDIETGFWMVIAMNPNITNNLKLEWYARDIVRQIQEARKEANYQVDDRIKINLSWEKIEKILKLFKNYIETETLSKVDDNLSSADLEKEIELNNLQIKLTIKR